MQDSIIIYANDPYDASASTRWWLGFFFWFSCVGFIFLLALLVGYIKRKIETEKLLNIDEHYYLFKCGPAFKSWGTFFCILFGLTAFCTGVSWLVLFNWKPPTVMFYAQGTGFHTPCLWNINATQTNMADVKEIKFDFGDGETMTTILPYASHTYKITPPIDTDQSVKVCVQITTKHNEISSNCLTLKLRNGYPQPKMICQITSAIKFAPVDVSCDLTSSFTRYPGRNITRWRINWAQCFGSQGFVDLKSPYDINHRVEPPGNCQIATEVGDNTGLMSVAPFVFPLTIPDGSPILNLDMTYVGNPYKSAPVTMLWDISRSQLVYPGAQWQFVRFVLPPKDEIILFNIPAGFGDKLPANVSQISRLINMAGDYSMTATIGDTTGRTKSQPLNFPVYPSNPIAVVNYKTEHNGYTLERLTIDCCSSRIMYPGRSIVSCEYSSPDLDNVDGKITTFPICTVSSGQKMISDPSTYSATIVAIDSAGQRSKPVTQRMPVKSGTPSARYRASESIFTRCDWADFNFYASGSKDPSGHTLQKYKWYQDGRLQSTQTKDTWSDSYMRFSGWSRDIRITLIVVSDQNVESDPFDGQLSIGKDYCKKDSPTEIHHTMGLTDITFMNLVGDGFNHTDVERGIRDEFGQHGEIETIVMDRNVIILRYKESKGALKAVNYLGERIDWERARLVIKE